MILGIVTNCFQRQLDDGVPLIDLIEQAERRGYRAIELRHGSLGEFATDDGHPDAERLTELPQRFPGVRFNVAISVSFLGEPADSRAPLFSSGRWAADAVAGENPPHLRLVDLKTRDADLETIDTAQSVEQLLPLVSAMSQLDGVLSIENGPQNWPSFYSVFQETRRTLGPEAGRLRLCYDPCNLLMGSGNCDPNTITASLSADVLSMVHLKQRCDGTVRPTFCDGDVDWAGQISLLRTMRYSGPFLLEVAPGDEFWENLKTSRWFLETIL